MSTGTKIEWAHHTFNPWWGCARVSPGCVHCYADTLASRWGHELWRRHGPRRAMAAQYWRQPLTWNRKAADADGPVRVFCASMADVFEAHPEPDVRAFQGKERARLWDLIDATPNLTWMLLTKRPENVAGMVPWGNDWPGTVWLGVSTEDQRRADERVPVLLTIPAAVRFVSAEPLLGPVDLGGHCWLPVSENDPDPDAECLRCGTEEFSDIKDGHPTIHRCYDHEQCEREGHEEAWCSTPVTPYPRISWVICGGESGRKARPMHPDWARSLRDQCTAAGVAFHFKQRGEWTWSQPGAGRREPQAYVCEANGRVADEATALADGGSWQGIWRVGKGTSGRDLDGEFWDEFPTAVTP